MNKDQFIYWLKGFSSAVEIQPTERQWDAIVSELEKIQDCPDYGSPIDKTIINPFPKINPEPNPLTPFKSTPNPYIGGQSGKVMYSEICSCNPANGGSGICGCVIGNKLVDRPNQGTINTGTSIIGTSTDTVIIDGFMQNASITRANPPSTLTYTTGKPVKYKANLPKDNNQLELDLD
jgi:hypothetical protein